MGNEQSTKHSKPSKNSNPSKKQKSPRNPNLFKIKVEIDEYETIDIFIEGTNTIKELKDKINKHQGKIDAKYVQLYKDNQLLEENKTVSSYNIKRLDTISIKSSREGEFLVLFCNNDQKVCKYVTKDDDVYSAFYSIKYQFDDNSRYGFRARLMYKGKEIYNKSTFEQNNIFNFCKIIVIKDYLLG